MIDQKESKKNMIDLQKKFKEIRQNELNKSLRDGTGGMGYTFETLIGKKEDSNFLPDYKGIEIKTKMGFGKAPLTLFCMNPKRNDKLWYSKYLLDNFGYMNPKDKNLKKFTEKVYLNNFADSKDFIIYKAIIDLKNNKLKIIIVDRNYNFIDDGIYWNLDELEERIYTKLSCLALINGYPYYKDGEKYFKYTKLQFYRLKSFYIFLELLERNAIYIDFNIDMISDKNSNYGKIHDRGVSFKLNVNYLDNLFEKIIL